MNILESLRNLDKKSLDEETTFYDLVSLYEGLDLSDKEKEELAKRLEGEDAEVVYDYLYKKFDEEDDDEVEFVDNRKNSIIRGDDDPGFDEYDLKEARSYGGAFDISDDQLFTREDLDDFGYRIVDELNAQSNSKFEYAGCWVDGSILSMQVEFDDGYGAEAEVRIDYRKLNRKNLDPATALYDYYASDVIQKLTKEAKESGADIGWKDESLTEDSHERWYVTVYVEDQSSGPEEGGWVAYGKTGKRSSSFATKEEAEKGLEQEVNDYKEDGCKVVNEYDARQGGKVVVMSDPWEEGEFSIALENSHTRGSHEHPAQSWAEMELGYEPERAYFDKEGERTTSPTLRRKQKERQKDLDFIYRNALKEIEMADTVDEIEDLIYARRDELTDIDNLPHDKMIAVFKAAHEKMNQLKGKNESLTESCYLRFCDLDGTAFDSKKFYDEKQARNYLDRYINIRQPKEVVKEDNKVILKKIPSRDQNGYVDDVLVEIVDTNKNESLTESSKLVLDAIVDQYRDSYVPGEDDRIWSELYDKYGLNVADAVTDTLYDEYVEHNYPNHKDYSGKLTESSDDKYFIIATVASTTNDDIDLIVGVTPRGESINLGNISPIRDNVDRREAERTFADIATGESDRFAFATKDKANNFFTTLDRDIDPRDGTLLKDKGRVVSKNELIDILSNEYNLGKDSRFDYSDPWSFDESLNEDLSTKVSVEQLVKMCDNEEGKTKLQKIVDTNNTQAFEELIEDMYPNGIALDSLFDLIQNDWDLVADELDLNESVNEAIGNDREYDEKLRQIDKDAYDIQERPDDKSPADVLREKGYEEEYEQHTYWKDDGIYTFVFDFTEYDDSWGEEPVKYYVLKDNIIPSGYTVTKMKLYDDEEEDEFVSDSSRRIGMDEELDEGILKKVVSGAKKLGNAIKNSAAASFAKGAYDNSVAKKVVDTAKKAGAGVKNYVKNDMPVKEGKYKIYYYNQEKEPEKVLSQDVIDTTGQTITRAQLVAAASKKADENQPQFRIYDANNKIIADTTSEKGAQEAEKNVEFQKKEADNATTANIKKMKDAGLELDEIKAILQKRGMDPKRIEQFVK